MIKLRTLLHKPFLFFSSILISTTLWCQVFPAKNYPKGYFMYPVQAKIALAANFGELRANHFHMGLDCKTDQHQNARVIAAADGYVAHVRIEPSGFGRAIYINHPNGLTTLYGHLNDFFPELEKYVKEQQYKLESWQVFLDIPPGLFPVKQGQFIAFSGSTGASQGPHVHFEIRNTKTDKVLNPLLFGLPIPDNVPPSLYRLAVYDRTISTYQQTPKLYAVKKSGDKYVPVSPVVINSERVSFGISAVDKYTGSSNPNGIYQAILYEDGKPVSGFQLDSITYDDTRYLNAHIDYKLKTSGGPYVEHLSRLPGVPEGVYKDFESDGVIETDDNPRVIKIEVKDPNGNTSVLEFSIKKGEVKNYSELEAYQKKFVPGYVNIFETEDAQVILGPDDLYDSVNFTYSKKPSAEPGSVSDLHIVHTALVPVHGHFTIRLKPSRELTAEETDRLVIERTWGGKTDVVKAKKDARLPLISGREPWYSGKFRNFGNFRLVVDNVPPTIIPAGIADNVNLSRSGSISFLITDNMKEIKNFRAELDGKWLRFTNDKGRSFIYKFDEMCPPGNHELKVSVEDEAGNKTVKNFHFVR